MKKLIIAFVLLSNIHTQASHYPANLCDYQPDKLYYLHKRNKDGTIASSIPVHYEQSSYPQDNQKETVHVYAECINIRNDTTHTETYTIQLTELKGKDRIKLEDGRTLRFTEITHDKKRRTYDMPKIERQNSCTIS